MGWLSHPPPRPRSILFWGMFIFPLPETGSPQKCFKTLGIKYAGYFPDNLFFGQDDIAESPPHAARLDAQTAWCTTSVTGLELGVTVSQRHKKVRISKDRHHCPQNMHWMIKFCYLVKYTGCPNKNGCCWIRILFEFEWPSAISTPERPRKTNDVETTFRILKICFAGSTLFSWLKLAV